MVKFMSGSSRGGSYRNQRDEGPPDEVIEVGEVLHSSEENQLLCKASVDQVPWFSKTVYLENKAEVGKVDEVLGPVTDFMFSVQVDKNMKAESFERGTKLFMSPAYLFPMSKFSEQSTSRGRGGRGRGGSRGGRGGSRGGGFSRGGGGFGRGGGGGFGRGAPRGGGGGRGGRGVWRPRG